MLAALVAASAPPRVDAQPVVRIRAETRIELRAERRGGDVLVFGALRDDLGAALPSRDVEIAVSDVDGPVIARTTSQTTSTGAFSARFSLPIGAFALRATYEGDDELEHVAVERRLDLDRAEVSLQLDVPNRGVLDLDVPHHELGIHAQSSEGGAGIALRITDELDRSLGEGTTAADGTVRVSIASRALGAVGVGRLVIRSVADPRRADAQIEVPILRFRHSRLTLEQRDSTQAQGRVTLVGRLFDSTGGLDRKAIGIFEDPGGAHVTTLLTGPDGVFVAHLTIPKDEERERWVLRARFTSDAPWRGSTSSDVVAIAIAHPASVGWFWFAMLAVVSAVTALVVFGARGRREFRERARAKTSTLGVETGRRLGLLADRFDVAGVALDARDATPLRSAEVTLGLVGGPIEVGAAVDGEGRFSFSGSSPGVYDLRIAADGYEPRLARVELPHRGEWSNLVVRLENLRGRTLDALAGVAEAVVPASPARMVTPRKLADEAIARHGEGAAVQALALRVESLAYGAVSPTLEDVRAVEHDALRQQRDAHARAAAQEREEASKNSRKER